MLRNYIKIAWRGFKKNKTFTFINVFGLATGLTSCLLIALYLNNELSYDKHYKNADRIYQLNTVFVKDGKESASATAAAPMAKTMQEVFPEIEQTTRLLQTFVDDKTLFQYNDRGTLKPFYEDHGFLADSTFFDVFTYQFKEGNPLKALSEPNSLVISEEIAKKIFGNESALDKVIHVNSNTNGENDFKVTGVFVPGKKPSHINARFFMSMRGGTMEQLINRQSSDLITHNMFFTYFRLKPNASAKTLESKFPAFVNKYLGEALRKVGLGRKFTITPLTEIHLASGLKNTVTPAGSVTYLYILASIALFTLLIACINFMNLSTARSAKRSAEVGVRKVLGAEKSALVRQFLSESILMSLFAFGFAMLVTRVMVPLFAQVSGREITFSFEQHYLLIIGFFILSLIAGVVAGSYPAWYLSSLKPVKALKGKLSNTMAAVSVRKFLVVFQFVISVVLIVSSIVIYSQMHFMRSKDLGFQREQQVIIPLRTSLAKQIYEPLKNELKKETQIRSVGACYYYPGIMNPSDMNLYRSGETINEAKNVFMNYVDDDLLQTLDIKPLAGRLFTTEFKADTNDRLVVNQKVIAELGFKNPQEAIGKILNWDWQGQTMPFTIVGVVNDFNFEDLHNEIKPFAFRWVTDGYNYLIVHTTAENMHSVLTSIESKWQKLNPAEPFEYSFLDADFAKNFQSEERLSSIVSYFTLIAILISCLGLFGLATYSAEQRIKEIGIRKVLGASISNIVLLLSKDFLKPVLIATLIAFPIAWYAMDKWLQDFAYRINIGWWMFIVAGLLAAVIALVTVSFQAVKAAVANPVNSLKTE
ncbi:ABC transporter permease [Solitalea sp. MAHUQ-68]|uniref:ABC transporter permease n=1 Tax=Solitalea agri TaxID=2953739 RepID=A0A9X2JBU4_9SPHI|nr:ABC transporter permease [Solitalea agri]MCO4291834.1 ABC transporter permease [Solitalea agri]